MYFMWRVALFRTCSCPGVARLGVPEDWIVQFVRQKETFNNLPRTAILEAIEQLVGDSLVYQFNTKSYKTVA